MKLLYVGKIAKDADWRMPTHSHPFAEIICFQQGRGFVWLRDRLIEPGPGSVLVYHPGEPHREQSHPRSPQETIYIGIDGAQALHRIPPYLWDRTGAIRWLCRELWSEAMRQPQGSWSDLVRCYLQAILCHLERAAGDHDPCGIPAWPSEAQRFIDEHYSDPSLDLTEVARSIGVSVSTLVHGFRRHAGMSPRGYLRHVRLERAAERLRETRAPVKAIALSVGYADPYHFSRAFRRHYGCSPSRYRLLRRVERT